MGTSSRQLGVSPAPGATRAIALHCPQQNQVCHVRSSVRRHRGGAKEGEHEEIFPYRPLSRVTLFGNKLTKNLCKESERPLKDRERLKLIRAPGGSQEVVVQLNLARKFTV